MKRPVFTVFTATYNRAHTLKRVYESLLNQTFTRFEWLIVDDGSTDNTEKIVSEWIKSSQFDIRYIKQRNQGKHVAFNLGVNNANGELFLPLDSDDTCKSEALKIFYYYWRSIPVRSRSNFSGITCLCQNELGDVVGGCLPKEIVDGHFRDVLSKLDRKGEMWGFHRTSVLREFPFPEFPDEKFVPEGLVWNRIGEKYQMRFINQALRYYYDSNDSISRKMTKIRAESPCGTIKYYIELAVSRSSSYEKIKASINTWRFIFLSGRLDLIKILPLRQAILWTIGIIPGAMNAYWFLYREKK